MIPISTAFTLFLSFFSVSLPFLLLGVIISSFLLVFVDEQRLAAKFPRNRLLGAIVGSFLGLILPVALYGNVPVTRRLLVHGVPWSVAISFLLASPTLNPLTLWWSWQVFPHPLALIVYRLLLTWMMAVALGFLFSFYPLKSRQLPPTVSFFLPPQTSKPLHQSGNLLYDHPLISPQSRSWRAFLENIGREGLELGGWLLLGCAIAAAVQTFFPQSQWLTLPQPELQVLVLMVFGFFLSPGSPFNIALVLPLGDRLLPGSLLAFWLFSSAIDIKQILLMVAAFRVKAIVYLLILIFQFSFLWGLALNFYGG